LPEDAINSTQSIKNFIVSDLLAEPKKRLEKQERKLTEAKEREAWLRPTKEILLEYHLCSGK
tara:strand:+ start:143 stop:328 length:186 start_codon:yes stop_codon:yes gene_type:complete